MADSRRKAPWPDYRGADIFEGDTIIHPSGETATVVFIAVLEDPWRAKYGNGESLWLGNQVGDKGQACVLAVKESVDGRAEDIINRAWHEATRGVKHG